MLSFLSVRAQLVLVVVILLGGLVGAGYYAYNTIEDLRVNGPIYTMIIEGNVIVADVLPPPKYIIEPHQIMLIAFGAKEAGDRNTKNYASPQITVRDFELYFEYLVNGAACYMDRHNIWVKDLDPNLDPRIVQYIEDIRQEVDSGKATPGYEKFDFNTNQFLSYIQTMSSRDKLYVDSELNRNLKQALVEDSYKPADQFFKLVQNEYFPALYDGLTDPKRKQYAAELAWGKLTDLYIQHRVAIDRVVGLAAVRNNAYERLAADSVDERYRNLLIGAGIMAVFSLLLVTSIQRAFSETGSLSAKVEEQRKVLQRENETMQKNVKELLMVVADASEGDLTVRARVSEGTLGNVADAFNSMMDTWVTLMSDIKNQFAKTDAAIAQIRDSATKMASGANQQVREIIEANSAVQRMSKDIEKVSQNAETAAAAARRTQESALAGSESVQNVIRGMESLRANVQAGAKKIKNLGDRSMEITGIVATIAKISDQTNMLALNAAIEAARAGEHGRGFNVVADEVRQLAERTANATQEIEKLVKTIQAETNESVAAIEQQTQVVEEEAQIVSQAGDSLAKIQEVSTQSAELISDISTTARQQVQGTQDVVKTMERVSEIARETQVSADRSSQITSELASLSQQVMQAVARFKTGGNGQE